MPRPAAGSIVITGASSGIGAALARQLSIPRQHLALIGRNPTRLSAVAADCTERGAFCQIGNIDVRDSNGLGDFLANVEHGKPIELLIANAGILDGRHEGETVESGDVARNVIETNLLSTIDIVHQVLPAMRRRRGGTIVLVASLASFVPLPDAPAYSASKAGLLSYGIALRDAVAADGVRVVVVCPGFVATAMTHAHIGPRLGEISADDAALRIIRGISRNRGIVSFPAPASWLSRLTLLGPEWMRRRGMRGARFHVKASHAEDAHF